ncbi:MAG: transposase [Sphingomonadaceae bacterium]|nr:transposase [Sphingomonadaceae bacterium]
MPRIIDLVGSESCDLTECVDALNDKGFDPYDEDSLHHAAAWLRKLGNNRDFLGDLLVDQLAGRENIGVATAYSPQAIVLSGSDKGFFLRANIWPAEQDYCFRASGAQHFAYGAPHDHNFNFLTVGYFGPGYASDYYEFDYEEVAGYRGEKPPSLRFVERSNLHEGKLMLYRAHVDVHSQIPPESLSVSLNVMATDHMQGWLDQYGFDLENGAVSRILNPGGSECLLRIAVGMGGEEARDFAEHVGRHHPAERMRLAAFEARSLLCESEDARDALWREAELSGSRMLEMEAKMRRAKLAELVG